MLQGTKRETVTIYSAFAVSMVAIYKSDNMELQVIMDYIDGALM